MKTRKRGVFASGVLVLAVLGGCSKDAQAQPDFSEIRKVAELATLDCYYHNVVMLEHDANGFLFGLGNIGYKRTWYEYSGIVKIGLDVSQVAISQPDADNVVTITIPPTKVLGNPDIDEQSFTKGLTEKGWFTSDFTADEHAKAFSEAQQAMVKRAQEDEALHAQAQERAKEILGRYADNVGKALGQDYTIEWKEVK